MARHSRIGFGRLVASSPSSGASPGPFSPTSLTTVCHQAPLRWIPVVKNTGNNNSMGSLVYQCHYGGGFLSNDHVVTDVVVQNHARLGIMTQGYNPIYTASTNATSCAASYKANYVVESNGLLVVAPDPIRVHAKSKYQQHVAINLKSNRSNLCYVDWIGAGRISQQEIWKHSFFRTTTEVFCGNGPDQHEKSKIPLMVESVQYESMLDNNSTHDVFDPYMGYTAFVTVLLHGPMLSEVIERFEQIQRRILLNSQLRIRKASKQLSENDDGNNDQQQLQLLQTLSSTGRIVMSMSEVPTNELNNNDDNDPNSSSNSLHVARLAATSNEDLYRILYYCLQPISEHFFFATTPTTTAAAGGGSISKNNNNNNNNKSFYSDRIRAVHSSSSSTTITATTTSTKEEEKSDDNNQQQHASSPFSSSSSLLAPSSSSLYASSNMMLWSASMVVDSALPVGGFAHSAGIEAASQILNNNNMGNSDSNTINSNSDDSSNHLARTWIRMATQSAATFNTPIVFQCHSWTKHALQGEELGSTTASSSSWLTDQLEELDQHVHSRLVSNPPACRASLDQGKNLLRVAQSWLQSSSSSSTSSNNTRAQLLVLEAISQRVAGNKQPRGHLATIFGVVTALLQLDDDQACHLLAYTVARDVVSAAVRLNLIGPIASVHLLANVQQAANRCILDGKQAYREALLSSSSSLENDAETSSSVTPATPDTAAAAVAAEAAITCAPLLDCIQPCHDLLAVRLFRT